MHDQERGAVRRLLLSSDARHLFSVGADDNFFMFNANIGEPLPKLAPRLSLRHVTTMSLTEEIMDESEMRSVEQVRAAEENERLFRLGEQHKKAVRAKIRVLRGQLGEWIARFKEQFPDMSDEELLLGDGDGHSGLLDILPESVAHLSQAVEQAKREVDDAVVMERFRTKLLLHRVKELFESGLEDCGGECVTAFGSDLRVETYRVEAMPQQYQEMLANLNEEQRAAIGIASNGWCRPSEMLTYSTNDCFFSVYRGRGRHVDAIAAKRHCRFTSAACRLCSAAERRRRRESEPGRGRREEDNRNAVGDARRFQEEDVDRVCAAEHGQSRCAEKVSRSNGAAEASDRRTAAL